MSSMLSGPMGFVIMDIIIHLWSLKSAAGDTPLHSNSWAILVAGSKGYKNYRHQADICHAYHVMLSEGIPAERVIVMMYDDIANNERNPNPGNIVNHPEGNDVYSGVKIDYKGNDVNPRNFFNILTGKKKAMVGIGTGRVVNSDNNTNIFLNYVGHGNTGVLGFPSGVLYANKLIANLNNLWKRKKYKKLIMYVESCYAGSMFDNLLKENTNVFVLTAAARDEKSYATYCVHEYETCLGDKFSVTWMEHMDSARKGTFETFYHQFDVIRTAVGHSHVQMYGDYLVGSAKLTPNELKKADFSPKVAENGNRQHNALVDATNASLAHIWLKTSKPYGIEYQAIIRGWKIIDALMDELVATASAGNSEIWRIVSEERLALNLNIFPCYETLVDNFTKHCFGLQHDYVLRQIHKFANICILQLDTYDLIQKMPYICSRYNTSVFNEAILW